jgi:hypothetical protein
MIPLPSRSFNKRKANQAFRDLQAQLEGMSVTVATCRLCASMSNVR